MDWNQEPGGRNQEPGRVLAKQRSLPTSKQLWEESHKGSIQKLFEGETHNTAVVKQKVELCSLLQNLELAGAELLLSADVLNLTERSKVTVSLWQPITSCFYGSS